MGAEVKVVPLEPCPFCGSSNVNHRYIRDGQQMFCQDCGGSAKPAFHGPNDDTIARAAAAWNRRAPTDEDPTTPAPGNCPECGAPWEVVRPGKSQPTCDCQDKCALCGTMRRHFSVGEIAKNLGGFLCPKCDADPTTPEAQAAARLSLRDTFIAEKGLWSEFAETVLHQQSSIEAPQES